MLNDMPPARRNALIVIIKIGISVFSLCAFFMRVLMYMKLGKIKAMLVPSVAPATDPTRPMSVNWEHKNAIQDKSTEVFESRVEF